MSWASRTSKRTRIPSSTSREKSYDFDDYSYGMNSFTGNDKFPNKSGGSNFWRKVQNGRITTLGEYETRKGFDFLSDAAGETEDQTITSTTGAADQSFTGVNRLAQVFTAGTTGRLTKIELNIKNDASAIGTIQAEIWSDSSGEPGTMLARSSIDASTPTSSYAYITTRFAEAPEVTAASDYWIVVYSKQTGGYKWSSTTSATTALASTDSGTTWSSTSYALNFKQHYATSGEVKGMIDAQKSDGTKFTFFAHGTVLYSINQSTGALTSVKTGLSSSATHYRFEFVNDVLYYVNGFDGYRKWDFSTESQVSATNYTHIKEHKGLMFLVEKTDPNKVVFSNFADYETFTSTDFVYVPSPKTGDPVTAIRSLNGYLILWTLRRKFLLTGSDNATFTLDEAPDEKGTYSQETTAQDKNFVYYISDDGIYRSNGSEPDLLSENIYEDVLKLANKDDVCMVVHEGRLYTWHRSAGVGYNNQCWVINLNYGGESDTIESLDTDAFVNRAVSFDGNLRVASSLVGQIYTQEDENNDYNNLGGDIEYLLEQHYNPYESPAVYKQIRYWKPRFESQSGNYTITAQYATDLRNNWQDQQAINVQGSGATWGGGETWGGGATYGTDAENQSDLYVPGEYRRIAIRYKHFAARQPHTFLGHSFVVQHRRLR